MVRGALQANVSVHQAQRVGRVGGQTAGVNAPVDQNAEQDAVQALGLLLVGEGLLHFGKAQVRSAHWAGVEFEVELVSLGLLKRRGDGGEEIGAIDADAGHGHGLERLGDVDGFELAQRPGLQFGVGSAVFGVEQHPSLALFDGVPELVSGKAGWQDQVVCVEPVGEGGGSWSIGKELELAVVQVRVAVTPRIAVRAAKGVLAHDISQSIEGECQQVLGGLGQGVGHGFGAFLFNAERPEIIAFSGQ